MRQICSVIGGGVFLVPVVPTISLLHRINTLLSPNQIVIDEHTVQPGPYRAALYKSYTIGNTDITAEANGYALWCNLIDYLNRYFADWKFIRHVIELPGSYTPYKRVTYLLEVWSDADAETIRSRLRKGLILPSKPLP